MLGKRLGVGSEQMPQYDTCTDTSTVRYGTVSGTVPVQVPRTEIWDGMMG